MSGGLTEVHGVGGNCDALIVTGDSTMHQDADAFEGRVHPLVVEPTGIIHRPPQTPHWAANTRDGSLCRLGAVQSRPAQQSPARPIH